ncbi:hypothetical protein J3R30DRAFT_3487617 [Lentinula aciculospora]|uniref:F-box domain-containing protein n=1 Tax=Lentinula aciculospora TaxID=153920 RepID=A0A9W9DMV1_9AGAR|nr:hypothetical protein J3R30DRAFT_3487617 [Lentinula aciculospora]
MSVNPPWDPLQSPYSSFLNTNYAASPSERLELETLLMKPQQELFRLDLEISRIQTLLDNLMTQRYQVKSFVDAHRALMAPIRRLPAETMAEVFVHCLYLERYPVRSLKEAPLLLTMVSRGWRDIALSLPRIWAAFHIHIA